MEDKSSHDSVSDITKPADQPASIARPSTVVNDNARNPGGQNHTMQGCDCRAWGPSEMQIDRPMGIDPYSEIGAKKFEH